MIVHDREYLPLSSTPLFILKNVIADFLPHYPPTAAALFFLPWLWGRGLELTFYTTAFYKHTHTGFREHILL